MEKNILIILVGKRNENASAIQQVFTQYGCLIKTRLGLHDGVLDECSNSGLIILELVGEKKKHEEMQNALKKIDKINTKLISITV